MGSSSKAASRAQRAAEARAAQERAERKRRILTVGAVVLVMVLIIGGAIVISLLNKDEVEASPAGASDYGVTIGDEDAPHTVIIYEDFLCPFCGDLEQATAQDLEELAADGKVLVEYRPFELLSQLGDYSLRATNAFAVVLDASGPEVAKEFHDLLFENQPPESAPGSVSDDDLVELAVEAGAAEDDVRDGIEQLAQRSWVVKATSEAEAAGVRGTPTILLDGEVFTDGRTVDQLADNLLAELE